MTPSPSSATATVPGQGSDATADEVRSNALQALEASFAELMMVFRRYMTEAADRVHPGMLPGTFKVLSAASRCGPTTLSALTERLTADKGLTSRALSELEELGLVTRTPDPEDRRSRLIAVTPLGEERLALARQPHESRLSTVLEKWSIGDIRHLTTLLHALATGDTPADAAERASRTGR